MTGDSQVGKTAIMTQYVNNKFNNTYKATIEPIFVVKRLLLMKRPSIFQIWDRLAKNDPESRSAFYRGSDGLILVCDLRNEESFRKYGGPS